MSLIATARHYYGLVISRLAPLHGIAEALPRVIVGAIFAQSGWGKLTHLERTIEFFTKLGIPAPGLQAPFVGSVELLGGVCLAIGLATRGVSALLIGVMGVALLTAILPNLESPADLIATSEVLYLALLAGWVVRGGGSLAVDRAFRASS